MAYTDIDTTIGGETSNSYGTVQELRDYFAHRSEASQFLALDDEVLSARLIQAALINDVVLTPYGKLASDTQRLAFPRKDLVDKHGRKYAEDVIPDKIKYAQFEQAFYCNTNNITIPSILTQGFIEAKLDVMSVKLDKDFVPQKLSYDVIDFLSLFGDVDSSFNNDVNSVYVVRY